MKQKPLAFRMRPTTLNQILGQKHLVSKGKPIYEMLKKGVISSTILYGNPGTGKTSLSQVIANEIDMPFRKINAVTDSKKDLERVIKEALDLDTPVCLAIDEIHKFTKSQVQYLLPFVEDATVILIGLTSENPYHNIVAAIRSRCTIYELQTLSEEDIRTGLKRALKDEQNGLGAYDIRIDDKIVESIAAGAGGDIRTALNMLEMTFLTSQETDDKTYIINEDVLESAIQKKHNDYGDGDAKYDILSAFHKSLRGSDVDAAILYLAKLIEGGDITGINRRILCAAYEDCASSMIGVKALTAVTAAERLGFPEARIPLASIVIDICLAPKSNAGITAIDKALSIVRSGKDIQIPPHLKDGHYASAHKLGRAIGYKYPHHYEKSSYGGWVPQQYLPNDMINERFYQPFGAGEEERHKKMHEHIKSEQYKSIKKDGY